MGAASTPPKKSKRPFANGSAMGGLCLVADLLLWRFENRETTGDAFKDFFAILFSDKVLRGAV